MKKPKTKRDERFFRRHQIYMLERAESCKKKEVNPHYFNKQADLADKALSRFKKI